jgi:hypothetical protein
LSRRILAYLIPLRILKGYLPSSELLDRFPLLKDLFSPFIAAIRKGDLKAYDSALEQWEMRLLELNLWLSLEKARELCMRGLFRRVYVLLFDYPRFFLLGYLTPHSSPHPQTPSWVATGKGTRIPISLFHTALRVSGLDVPEEEAECYVANQIYKNFMRGYISHEKQMVVLASVNTFPKVVELPSPLANL